MMIGEFQQHRQDFTQLEPVAGGVGEVESALSSKASTHLDGVNGMPVERRQGGKVETHSDLVSGRELSEEEEMVIGRC